MVSHLVRQDAILQGTKVACVKAYPLVISAQPLTTPCTNAPLELSRPAELVDARHARLAVMRVTLGQGLACCALQESTRLSVGLCFATHATACTILDPVPMPFIAMMANRSVYNKTAPYVDIRQWLNISKEILLFSLQRHLRLLL